MVRYVSGGWESRRIEEEEVELCDGVHRCRGQFSFDTSFFLGAVLPENLLLINMKPATSLW